MTGLQRLMCDADCEPSLVSLPRMVELGRVSRSGFYRFEDAEPGPDRDMELRDAIQKITGGK